MWLFTIYIPALVKYLFRDLAWFLIGLFIFLLSFQCYLYILNTSLLLDICSLGVFVLFTMSSKKDVFILMKSNISIYSFKDHAYGFVSKKYLLNPRFQGFLLCFFKNFIGLDSAEIFGPFWVNFCIGTIWIEVYVFLLRYIQCFSAICWNDYPFSTELLLLYLSQHLVVYFYVGLILDSILFHCSLCLDASTTMSWFL